MDILYLLHSSKRSKEDLLKEYLLVFAVYKVKEKKQKTLTTLKRKKRLQRKKQIYQVIHRLFSYLETIKPTQVILDIYQSFINTFKEYKKQFSIILATSLVIFFSFNLIYQQIFKNLPSPLDLTKKEQIVSTKILDRNGKVLYRIYEDENRSIIPLSDIPKSLIFATIAIEDKNFYHHHGFSITGITRAFISNLKNEKLQGGSTITQQLVKNRLLTPKRTLSRKIKELLLSVLIEGVYTKDEILEMYLNQVAYGGSTYGVEEASHRYFNKNAKDLTLAESAMLAGLPAAPSAYTPFGANPELAFKRQKEVLNRMVENKYISQEIANKAMTEKLAFNSSKIDIKAPHFVMYIKNILAQEYGEELLNKGGLEVTTTLDLDLQQQAEKIVSDEVTSLKRLRVSNGASMVTNPQTGEVLAMVGSTNYFDFDNDGQVNVTLRERQPGSSIKPINYTLALINGRTTNSYINDSPITYHFRSGPNYSPKNYDGKYHGNVTLREALACSYNIPAVKLLAENGVSNMIDLAEQMGITTWQDRKRFGLSLTLGGGEVRMIDMTEVYGTLANQGIHTDINPILEVRDYKGTLYYHNDCALDHTNCPSKQIIDPEVSFLISNILADNQARTPAFGPMSTLNIPNQEVAVKTGTTNNLRDNWTFGYTSDRLVAVWVGNNDNTSMSYVASGITGASPIWNKIMRTQLSKDHPHTFTVPNNIIKKNTCIKYKNGKIGIKPEYFIKGTEPKTTCSTNWPLKQLKQ